MLRADGRHLFGANGLCGAHFAVAKRHHQHPSVKVICDEVRAAPGDVTIVATGPLTNIAAALQQQPDLASLIGHLIILGGTLAGPGNVTAAAEFNIYCDAEAARDRVSFAGHQDAHSDRPHEPRAAELRPAGTRSRTATRGAASCCGESCPARFARIASSWAWRAFTCTTRWRSSRRCEPDLFTTERMYGDVETDGTLTYGATVFDRRRHPESRPNMDVAVDMDTQRRDGLHRAPPDASGVSVADADSLGLLRIVDVDVAAASAISTSMRIGLPSRRTVSGTRRPISVSFTRLMRCMSCSIADAVEFEDHVVDLQLGLLGRRLAARRP